MAREKHDWQDKPNQRAVECSYDDCSKRLKINDDKFAAVRAGWAVHNGEWICPAHRAELDAPAEEAARREQAVQAEKAAELANKIERSVEAGKLVEDN